MDWWEEAPWKGFRALRLFCEPQGRRKRKVVPPWMWRCGSLVTLGESRRNRRMRKLEVVGLRDV